MVLDLVVFGDPGVAALRAAIEARRATLLTSEDCLAELRRVLAYPEFALDAAAREAAFQWYESDRKSVV